SRRLATYTLPTILLPNNTPTMDHKALEADVEKALRRERTGLRTLISNFHNMLIGGNHQHVSVQLVKTSYSRLSEIDTQLLGHLLAQDKDPDAELAENKDYADKVASILSSHPDGEPTAKAATSSKFLETKLPLIVAKDPASWLKFRILLELAPGAKTATNDEKKAKLVAALPPNLAIDVLHLSFTEAVRKLEVEFESEESLRTTIRELFRKLPKVKHLDDQAGMKGVHEAIDSVISLAIKAGLEKETMSLSLRKLTKPVIYGFFNDYESKQLSD